ncbi:hypothetical protein FOMPIDRAFT_1052191 [Fomitopsis schrenkii]|uniref:Uncharacterized protein n=1 Tax=Fomitopsis schrenkii TaxID=2126942 RepID=S8F7J9_FOMSC|nr:hypothetical protein FOMPIDRAFT_1052191 [Fomitopsis schrenkii]
MDAIRTPRTPNGQPAFPAHAHHGVRPPSSQARVAEARVCASTRTPAPTIDDRARSRGSRRPEWIDLDGRRGGSYTRGSGLGVQGPALDSDSGPPRAGRSLRHGFSIAGYSTASEEHSSEYGSEPASSEGDDNEGGNESDRMDSTCAVFAREAGKAEGDGQGDLVHPECVDCRPQQTVQRTSTVFF